MLSRIILLLYVLISASVATLYAKNILVTGGAGFIGSHVTKTLIDRGDTVYVIDNMNDFYDPLLKINNLAYIRQNMSKISGKFEFFQYDINDMTLLKGFFDTHHVDVICHLAARAGVLPSLEDPILYTTNNVTGTVAILEMAKLYNIPHVVIASSSSVYGNNVQIPFTEDDEVNCPCSPYAATKRATELLAQTYYYLYNISCTCLRFFTVYGPRGRVDMSPFKFLHAIHNELPIKLYGDGSAIRDYTYIADIVDGVIKAIDVPLGFEIINLGRGEPIILSDFIKVIEDLTHKKAIIHQLPMNMGDVAITHANVDKAKRLLGYQPSISIKQGIQEMYAWYMGEYLHKHVDIQVKTVPIID